jgi:alpha-tubulin suppressor-like RCC1 family protein
MVTASCEVLAPDPEPAALVFVQEVAGATGGTPFTAQPIVEVRDKDGRRVTKATNAITIALQTNPAGGTLNGTLTVAAVGGVATFTDLALDKAGSGYFLAVSAEGLASAISEAFDVVAGPPAKLLFVAEPAGGASSTPFPIQPAVEVVDAGGNRITTEVRDVTISVGINPAAATLLGTATVTTVAGVATFADLILERGGTGYRLAATAPGLASDTTGPFDVAIRFATISVSNGMGCGLSTAGDGYCWGRNQLGGLGIGSAGANRSRPTLLAGVLRFALLDVGAGSNENGIWDGFGCGIATTGATYCWGRNNFGQLGNGTRGADSYVPLPVSGNHAFVKLSAAQDHVCALTAAGDAYCWGRNVIGQLGDGTTNDRNEPVRVLGGHVWASIDANSLDTCAITSAGDVYCWGAQPSRFAGPWNTVPTRLSGGLKLKQISTGSFLHRCGVSTSDDAYCWGQNFYGELGNGSDTTDSATPMLVSGGQKFRTVQASGQYSCGLTLGGDAYCWGGDFGIGNGVLGQGSFATSSVPLKVKGGLTFTWLSVGHGQSCALTLEGMAYCWGSGYWGERADGTFEPARFTPVPVVTP